MKPWSNIEFSLKAIQSSLLGVTPDPLPHRYHVERKQALRFSFGARLANGDFVLVDAFALEAAFAPSPLDQSCCVAPVAAVAEFEEQLPLRYVACQRA